MTGHLSLRAIAATLLILAGANFNLASAQTCQTLLGDADCGAPSAGAPLATRGATSSASGPTALSTQALGRGLTVGAEQTGMFGALTFGGSGNTCSGPFRVRRC